MDGSCSRRVGQQERYSEDEIGRSYDSPPASARSLDRWNGGGRLDGREEGTAAERVGLIRETHLSARRDFGMVTSDRTSSNFYDWSLRHACIWQVQMDMRPLARSRPFCKARCTVHTPGVRMNAPEVYNI